MARLTDTLKANIETAKHWQRRNRIIQQTLALTTEDTVLSYEEIRNAADTMAGWECNQQG